MDYLYLMISVTRVCIVCIGEPEVPAVSRSGRIIKKSTKLLGFESSDIRT